MSAQPVAGTAWSAGAPATADPPTIAIDGPSGAGKSTVARGVARRLGWGYLDTGATYRAVTLAALRVGLVPDPTEEAVTDELAALAGAVLAGLELSTDPERACVRLDGEDVTAEIRGDPVTAAVSAVSAQPGVRGQLSAWQRGTARVGPGCVAEGRDVGTVVLPDAALKIWLTAGADARATRRAEQDARGGESSAASVRTVRASIERRDGVDGSRATAPAQPAADAVLLDSSDLDAAAVIDAVLALAAQRGLLERAT